MSNKKEVITVDENGNIVDIGLHQDNSYKDNSSYGIDDEAINHFANGILHTMIKIRGMYKQ